MSAGPYAGGGWCEDRPTRAQANAEMPTADQLEALMRVERDRVARLSPDERAAYWASLADPWAVTP